MLDLSLIFDPFGDDPKMGPKTPQKSAVGRPGPPRDADGRPEGSMEQFWSLWGPMFDPFGCNFGSIWVAFLHLHRSSCFPVLVTSFWLHPNNSGSAGVRVSAYN